MVHDFTVHTGLGHVWSSKIQGEICDFGWGKWIIQCELKNLLLVLDYERYLIISAENVIPFQFLKSEFKNLSNAHEIEWNLVLSVLNWNFNNIGFQTSFQYLFYSFYLVKKRLQINFFSPSIMLEFGKLFFILMGKNLPMFFDSENLPYEQLTFSVRYKILESFS